MQMLRQFCLSIFVVANKGELCYNEVERGERYVPEIPPHAVPKS